MADVDLSQPPRPAPSGSDRRSILQRALVCELTGRLDCALVLIRRLRDLDPTGGPASPSPC
jgi:hypothetical protein